jgi:hypothetical protein
VVAMLLQVALGRTLCLFLDYGSSRLPCRNRCRAWQSWFGLFASVVSAHGIGRGLLLHVLTTQIESLFDTCAHAIVGLQCGHATGAHTCASVRSGGCYSLAAMLWLALLVCCGIYTCTMTRACCCCGQYAVAIT